MFDDFLNELNNLDGEELKFDIEADEDGFIDKECPNEECLFEFKVHQDDWQELFKDESVYCPMCRHEGKSDQFYTSEQIENAQEQALGYITGKLDKALEKGAKKFNRKNKFIQVSIKGVSRSKVLVPLKSREEFQRKLKCEVCGSRYAVIGSAYFCPCCGYNSVVRTFDDSLEKIYAKLDNISVIRKALEEIDKKDEGEITSRSIIESCLSDSVVAFQRFCEELYKEKSGSEKVPFNAFQNIERGNDLWKKSFGVGYEDWIEQEEYDFMNRLFQKRHLLLHTEGIVDQKYLDKSSDRNYKVGQRIIIKDKEIRKLVNIIRKITNEIKQLNQ
jgi:hypothetical protein